MQGSLFCYKGVSCTDGWNGASEQTEWMNNIESFICQEKNRGIEKG